MSAPQHPAAPEAETDADGRWLTDAEDVLLAEWWVSEGGDHEDLALDNLATVVERIVAERVRVVEGEREHWKDHAEEAGRGFERVCLDYNRVAAARTAATARAESAEAAHEAEKAAHERLRAEVEALAEEWADHHIGHGDYPSAAKDIRSLLGGGEADWLAALLDRVRREEGARIAQAIEAQVHAFGQTDPGDPLRAGLIEGYRDSARIARAASVGRGEGQ